MNEWDGLPAEVDEVMGEVMDEVRREHRGVEAPAHLERRLREEAERKTKSPSRTGAIWAWGLSVAMLAAAALGVGEWAVHRGVGQGARGEEKQARKTGASPEDRVVAAALPETEGTQTVRTSGREAARRPRSAGQANGQVSGQTSRAGVNGGGDDSGAGNSGAGDSGMGQEEWPTEFVALPASEGLPPAAAVSLVRMNIQQAALQQYGFEVPAEMTARTLLAEFVVGEDGLPRAIRILPSSQP